MIKILFSDLDGTLLYNEKNGNHSDPVSEANCQAISTLQKQGVHFAVATSRSQSFLAKKMQLESTLDTVAFNGNLVMCDGKIIDCVQFTKEEIIQIMHGLKADVTDNRDMFITKDNDVVFYDISSAHAQGYVQNKLNYVQDHRQVLEEGLVSYLEHDSDQICFIIGVFPNKELCDESRSEMKKLAGIQMTDTSERTFTLTKGNRDKVTGILKIAEYYGIGEDEIAVIGDSYNDVQMMERFAHSFCMSHAPQEIQAHAANTVNSVAECIEMILEMNGECQNGIV